MVELNDEEMAFLRHLQDIGSANRPEKRLIRYIKSRCRSCRIHSRGMLECDWCMTLGGTLTKREW